ncbi:MAG: hypothetical protein NUV67_02810, partial [archaeon]|nr:hypothetical protein [archaeon]
FAGVFAFKLLEFDSPRLSGRRLWTKEIIGFAGLGALYLVSLNPEFAPETYFVAGAWVTFIYPFLWQKLLEPPSRATAKS